MKVFIASVTYPDKVGTLILDVCTDPLAALSTIATTADNMDHIHAVDAAWAYHEKLSFMRPEAIAEDLTHPERFWEDEPDVVYTLNLATLRNPDFDGFVG